jgi:CheY-like chemotaxis protein
MEQVLINLYVNAWQAMPRGGELHLETRNVAFDRREARRHGLKPGNYVKIAVRDTGVGIDGPIRERVFEPFFTTKEVGKGTGLGLASAFGIIKNHGGIIDFASAKGSGTTFFFYLPAYREVVPVEKPAVETIEKGTGTILLVDDETIILEAVRPMLEQMGYAVWTAANGREALSIFEKKNSRIDLVILDMVMPDIGGGEVFDRMKMIRPDVRVLLSSGYSLSGRATQIMERGCAGFIQKPFGLRSLSREIKTILDR